MRLRASEINSFTTKWWVWSWWCLVGKRANFQLLPPKPHRLVTNLRWFGNKIRRKKKLSFNLKKFYHSRNLVFIMEISIVAPTRIQRSVSYGRIVSRVKRRGKKRKAKPTEWADETVAQTSDAQHFFGQSLNLAVIFVFRASSFFYSLIFAHFAHFSFFSSLSLTFKNRNCCLLISMGFWCQMLDGETKCKSSTVIRRAFRYQATGCN